MTFSYFVLGPQRPRSTPCWRSGASGEAKVEELGELEKINATTVSEHFLEFLITCNFVGGH